MGKKITSFGKARKGRKRYREGRSFSGSALITTMMVIAVLSIIVVAFVESMRMERMASRSYTSQEKARLAAEAGGKAALALLSKGVEGNSAYLVGLTNDAKGKAVTVVAVSNFTDGKQMIPLISGFYSDIKGFPENENFTKYLNERTKLPVPPATTEEDEPVRPTLSSNVNLNLKDRLIKATNDREAFLAPWVNMVTTNRITSGVVETNARYAFIVVDEGGRWNPSYHGDTDPEFVSRRTDATNWYGGAGEIALEGVFSEKEMEAVRRVVTNVQGLHTVANGVAASSSGNSTSSSTNPYDAKKHLLGRDDTPYPEVVPQGYIEAGMPKMPINELATNTVDGGVFWQSFVQRAGKLADDFLSNNPGDSSAAEIAAWRVGLKTADTPAERIASYLKYLLPNFGKIGAVNDTNHGDYIEMLGAQIADFIDEDSEISVDPDGKKVYRGSERLPVCVGVQEDFLLRSPLPPPVPVGTTNLSLIRSIFAWFWNPYEKETVDVTKISLVEKLEKIQVKIGATNLDFVPPQAIITNALTTNFTLLPNKVQMVVFPVRTESWQQQNTNFVSAEIGVMLEAAEGGTNVANTVLSAFSMNDSGCAAANFGDTNEPSTKYTRIIFPLSKEGSNGVVETLLDPKLLYLQNGVMGENWQAISFQDAPTNAFSVAATPAPFSARIKDSRMASIGELGLILDPRLPDGYSATNADDLENDQPITLSFATNAANLEVGRPQGAGDHPPAWQLLDLFTVRDAGSEMTNYPFAKGTNSKINVNTASEEILASLFEGVQVQVLNGEGNPVEAGEKISATNAKEFASNIVKNRPYFSSGSLATNGIVGSSLREVLQGVVNSDYKGNPIAEEQGFGKVVEHTTVQSRAFRVYVIGQSLDKSGRVLSQAAAEAQIAVTTDTNGKPKPVLRYWRWEN